MSLTNPKYPGLTTRVFWFLLISLVDAAMISYIVEFLDKEEWDPWYTEAGDTSSEWMMVAFLTAIALLLLLRIIKILRNPVRYR